MQVLTQSAKLAPDVGASKWLYLGQLQEGWHALQSFSKGAEVLRAELAAREGAVGTSTASASAKAQGGQGQGQGQGEQEEEGDAEAAAIRNQLCSAQCSIAELYLTDLCFEEDAEARCQAALDEAVAMDQGSPEVSQALASLRLSQQRGEEAAPLMLETYRRLKACQAEDGDDEEGDEGMDVEGAGEGGGAEAPRGLPMPSVMFRVQTGKLLLECQAYNRRCARRAVRVLEQCKCEDDESLETWYLLGVAYFTKPRPDLELARAHLQYAQDALERQRKEHRRAGGKAEDFPQADQLRLVREQLALVAEAEEQRKRGQGQGQEGGEGEGESDSSSSSGSSDEESEGEEEGQGEDGTAGAGEDQMAN